MVTSRLVWSPFEGSFWRTGPACGDPDTPYTWGGVRNWSCTFCLLKFLSPHGSCLPHYPYIRVFKWINTAHSHLVSPWRRTSVVSYLPVTIRIRCPVLTSQVPYALFLTKNVGSTSVSDHSLFLPLHQRNYILFSSVRNGRCFAKYSHRVSRSCGPRLFPPASWSTKHMLCCLLFSFLTFEQVQMYPHKVSAGRWLCERSCPVPLLQKVLVAQRGGLRLPALIPCWGVGREPYKYRPFGVVDPIKHLFKFYCQWDIPPDSTVPC